ncbi:MAG: hypothetical protein ABIO72_00330 [Patescibacteria group bacterium]
MDDYLPGEAADFKQVETIGDGIDPALKGNHNTTILKLEIADKRDKLWSRRIFAPILVWLLLVQNLLVYYFIFAAYSDGKLGEAATVLSIICTATLVETAAIVHTMVKWVFTDMEYKIRN